MLTWTFRTPTLWSSIHVQYAVDMICGLCKHFNTRFGFFLSPSFLQTGLGSVSYFVEAGKPVYLQTSRRLRTWISSLSGDLSKTLEVPLGCDIYITLVIKHRLGLFVFVCAFNTFKLYIYINWLSFADFFSDFFFWFMLIHFKNLKRITFNSNIFNLAKKTEYMLQ